MTSGSRAIFVISWSQTEAEGSCPASPAELATGVSWRWSGEALRVDAPRDILLLEGAMGMADMKRGAARMAGRLIGGWCGPGCTVDGQSQAGGGLAQALGISARSPAAMSGAGSELAGQSFIVSDGRKCWTASLLPGAANLEIGADEAQGHAMKGRLLAFEGEMPPRGRELWLVRSTLALRPQSQPRGVICFTPGTAIRTPRGAAAVETLRPGDLVLTRDNGPREVLWTGSRHLSGARLHAMPHLRPVRLCEGALGQGRPDGDLLVSPSHRILLRGAAARALFNSDEVLVRAADLIDDRGIRTDLTLRDVTYHHILLEQHEILFANGVEADSFHPGEADPAGLDQDDHARMMDLLPHLREDPMGYGDFARRRLTAPETALLRYDLRR